MIDTETETQKGKVFQVKQPKGAEPELMLRSPGSLFSALSTIPTYPFSTLFLSNEKHSV